MTDLSGHSLGRYHILEQLGEGGMATVYKAYDTHLERDVAIKVIRVGQFGPDIIAGILKRFEREAKALAKLSHPNIIKILDYGEHDDSPYLVMEYLSGGTLKERMRLPISWPAAVRLLLPVLSALEYAHEHKIIHRDVKPANILLTERGQPMLTDFGIAKILETEAGQTLTGTGVGIGTPEYMAPEQGLGKPVDGRADLYALGIVLYELVTGRKPYTADTPMAVVFKHISDPLSDPREFVPDLPESVAQILFKALSKAPEDRYADAQAFADALEKLLQTSASDIPTVVVENIPPIPGSPPPDESPQKSKMWAWFGLIVLVVFLLVAGVFAMQKGVSKPLEVAASATQLPTNSKPPDVIPSATQLPPTITVTPVASSTVKASQTATPKPILIKKCRKDDTDVCLYSYYLLNNNSMYVLFMNLDFMPQYILVDSKKFECQLSDDKAKVRCTGPKVAWSSSIPLVVYNETGKNIVLQGEAEIPYVKAPAVIPTKKPGRSNDTSPEQGTSAP